MPVRGPVDSSDVARKRAFLLLEDERRSLVAELRPPWRPRGRYEDLSLVVMLARLERDWLGQRLPDWARPWGAAPRTKLQADIDHHGDALKRLGRWLPRRTVAKAERTARRRLTAITAELRETRPRPPAPAPAARRGAAPGGWRVEPPSRTRVAAIAGLLLLAAGAGAVLLAAPQRDGSTGSVGGPGAVGGVDEGPRGIDVQVRRAPGRGGRGPSRSGTPRPRRNAVRSSQGSATSTPVASEPAPAPPAPSLVAEPVAAPQPAPAPATPDSSAGQAKDAGGCPPEFGYEC